MRLLNVLLIVVAVSYSQLLAQDSSSTKAHNSDIEADLQVRLREFGKTPGVALSDAADGAVEDLKFPAFRQNGFAWRHFVPGISPLYAPSGRQHQGERQ